MKWRWKRGPGYRLHHQTSATAVTSIDPATVWKVGGVDAAWICWWSSCAKVGRAGPRPDIEKVDDKCKWCWCCKIINRRTGTGAFPPLQFSLSLFWRIKKRGVTAEIITRRATRTSVPTGRIHATAKTSSSGRDTHKRSSNSRPSQTAAVRPRGKKLVETPWLFPNKANQLKNSRKRKIRKEDLTNTPAESSPVHQRTHKDPKVFPSSSS